MGPIQSYECLNWTGVIAVGSHEGIAELDADLDMTVKTPPKAPTMERFARGSGTTCTKNYGQTDLAGCQAYATQVGKSVDARCTGCGASGSCASWCKHRPPGCWIDGGRPFFNPGESRAYNAATPICESTGPTASPKEAEESKAVASAKKATEAEEAKAAAKKATEAAATKKPTKPEAAIAAKAVATDKACAPSN